MAQSRYQFEPLAGQHDRASFSCGVAALDRYFQQQAGQDQRRYVAAVIVLFDSEVSRVVGFYTLSAASIEVSALPPEDVRRLPRYPTLPAIMLGRLAVDERYRGQGFGELLLRNALQRAFDLRVEIGAIAVLVDAIDDRAAQFYERYGFRRVLDDPRRLFMMLADIARLVRDP